VQLSLCFMSRAYTSFSHKGANFRIASDRCEVIQQAIVSLRAELDTYIAASPAFATALEPLPDDPAAPDIARRMLRAARGAGVGPMAAVAGTVAELAARAALQAGAEEAIVENGGDIYVHAKHPVYMGIYAGANPLSGRLAFKLEPDYLPAGICSSSSTMGHSLSFGNCDLVTVFSKNTSIADAMATSLCNSIQCETDVDMAAKKGVRSPGVLGVFIVKGNSVGMAGRLPELIKCSSRIDGIITADPGSQDLAMIQNLYKNIAE
jgi:uncharacterized protein